MENLNDINYLKNKINKMIELKTKSYRKDDLEWVSSAWSDRDFAIFVSGKENVEKLEKIYNAFLNNEIIIYNGSLEKPNVFTRYGLCFEIISELSDERKEKFLKEDINNKEIVDASAGILNKLKENNCKYYACSPYWIDDEKTALRFFLNPCDQKNNYSGWVSEKDLEDWCEGKGFIPGNGTNFKNSFPE